MRLQNLALLAVASEELRAPLAVVEPVKGQLRIAAANETARKAGLVPGMKLGAALALAGSLEIRERSMPSEREQLESLAACAYRLTSCVSIEWPDSLLLEVRGSLKLFGGLANIKEALSAALRERGFRFALCAAPTPLAALWLARGAREDVLELDGLAGRLGTLTLETLQWPDDVLGLLAEMGVRTIGECLRLPRDGFARRIGADRLRELDRALGRQADPRLQFRAQPALCGALELGVETTQTEMLAEGMQTIVTTIASDLRKRQCQVQCLSVIFHHVRRSPTVTRLQLIEPSHEVHRLLDPLLARLERTVLPAPVIAIGIETDTPVPMRLEGSALFAEKNASRHPVSPAALVESLRARFGSEGVYGLKLLNDHRPERVWTKLTNELLLGRAGAMPLFPDVPDRPLWILPSPSPLSEELASTCRDQPERIESGWWDGGDVRRDYYVVTTKRRQRLWVYQDCATREWYLHGIFG